MSRPPARANNYRHFIQIVEGSEAIDDALVELSDNASKEVCSFVTGFAPSDERLRQGRELNADLYARAVRSRTIYLTEVREHEWTMDHVNWLNEQGSEVRTLPDLPLQMKIIDAKTAVLPFLTKSQKRAIVIHREPSVVYSLQALFELNWKSASPLGLTFDQNGSGISYEDRILLEMLSLGRMDKEICKEIGLSERTVTGRISKLMARLNAKTRFAAGVQAAKRNWI